MTLAVKPGKVARALGVACTDQKIYVYYQSAKNSITEFNIDESDDGEVFRNLSQKCSIKLGKILFDIDEASSFRIFKDGEKYRLLFQENAHGKLYLNSADSEDLINWEGNGRLFPISDSATYLPSFTFNKKKVIFTGGKKLSMASSSEGKGWNISFLDVPENNYIAGCIKDNPEGPLFVYFLNEVHDDHSHFSIWSVLLDKANPVRILWKTNREIWSAPQEWIDKKVEPIGIIEFKGKLYSFWDYPGVGIFNVAHFSPDPYALIRSPLPHARLIKNKRNPILLPHPGREWESKQVFNPAAVLHNGNVHLLYRAIGDQDISVLGYAVSSDGITIDKRFSKPAYIPRESFEFTKTPGTSSPYSKYLSGGGGYGGIEDPRITKIDDKFFLTYVAFDGRNPPRVALTFIKISDFEDKKWGKWSKPVLISPPGVVDKNAAILPEKINGKYVIFHRIYPDILIDEVNNLEDFDGKSVWLKGQYKIHPRADFWDSNKVGIGPPPIKTKDGWLAIYQGVGFQDNSRYKIGAMLLDLKNPSKVLYRSSHPILEPEEFYENGGFKAGVVYPCGAVVINGTLIVYYGGSDTYIAAATANLNEFLDELKFDLIPHIDPVSLGVIPKYVETV